MSDAVWDWHDAGNHHNHSGLVGGLPMTVCCVCDNDSPCVAALDETNAFDDATCPGRNRRGERCENERGENSRGLCADCLIEHYEDLRERYLLDRHNERTGATL